MVLLGEAPKFTSLGLLSGLLWVLGGTGGIFAIRQAGMAIAVGTWASTMVLVNFVWGIMVFKEPVHSLFHAFLAFFFLGTGLVGMSKYSSPPKQLEKPLEKQEVAGTTTTNKEVEMVDFCDDDEEILALTAETPKTSHIQKSNAPSFLFQGVTLSKFQCGLLGAVWNGILAGSSLLPLHYAKDQGFGGLSYMVSFGVGSFFAQWFVWLVYIAASHILRAETCRSSSSSSLSSSLSNILSVVPEFHFRKLWKRGISAGLLLAIGMFCSIEATTSLGQGVGNSLIQMKILISGIWGIGYFREITNPQAITKWFGSALLSVASILWLTYERAHASNS